MGTIFLLIMIGVLSGGCYSPKANRYEMSAYQLASPENKLRMEQGKIEAGMSIEECKVSSPDYQFFNKFISSDSHYELWEVKDSQGKSLFFLQVVNGRVEKVSKYTETQKAKSRRK